ncbi:MAG: TonB-dependent receptor [Prevotella sp.]|nr:TonB-dependent receptor [Prevotella sp.]
MKKRLTMFLAGLFLCVGTAMAQTKVSGTVYSQEDGQPIIGAAVKVVGTSTGMLTDINGKFNLTLPEGKNQLEITYLGYEGKTVQAKNGMRVFLKTDAAALDEVVVVAYGTTKKSSFTGSAQNVNGEKLELRPISNVAKGLEGNTSGVQVTSGSGQPGSDPAIRIRGFGSINASSSPLYVVDGIPYDGALSSINPSDIESMTVLKDASAGALYGARGANGVIMITTKKGKEGKAQVTWRSTAGWSSRALPRYELVGQKDFVQLTYEGLRNEAIFNNGMSWEDGEAYARSQMSGNLGGELYNPFKNYSWDQLIDPATGYIRADAQSAWNEDWLDAVKRDNAFRHEHQLNINGGTDKTKYMLSLGYLNEDGILKTTGFQRYTARVNVDTQVTDWFKANLSTNLAHTISNFSDYDGSSTSNVWYSAQFVSPLFPMYVKDLTGNNVLDENGNPQLDYGDNATKRPGSYNDFNPLGGLVDDKAENKRDAAGVRTGLVFGTDNANAGWLQGLKFAINFGMDYNSRFRMRYMNMHHGNQATSGGLLQKFNYRTQSYTFNQLLTWNRSFGKHNLDVLAGHEFYAYKMEYLTAGKTNLVEGIYELAPAANMYDADSYTDNYRINSYLSRINYNYDDKYYLSASLRSDASSRFYKENWTGTFWSIGGNWRISKENFMKDVKWVNNLSFKASYGEQGNDDILNSSGSSNFYLWQALYALGWNNGNNIGAVVSTLETKDLSWEKNQNFNIGLEGALFDNLIRFSVEYYNKKTSDMLLEYPMALSTGFSGYNANVGDMRNRGLEAELTISPFRHGDFHWDITLMGSTVSNKVLHLTAESPEIISGVRIIKEGYPINTFYMAKSAGVDPATGAQLYWSYEKDEDGNMKPGTEYITSDYTEANNHKYFLGSRIPDFYGSLSTNLSYKGLDLSVLTTYSIGGKIYDSLYRGAMEVQYATDTWSTNALRRWQHPGDITDVPRIEIGGSYAANDRYLIDASYFAIKNITLGYTLPKPWMTTIGLNNIRVFASVDNLALFTHLDGMDPQYNFSGGTDYSYTPNKTWTVGFEVKF